MPLARPPAQAAGSAALPIAAVARDTGLAKDTLRVWERRYGFPQPVRDAHDERLYPPEQVERLRLIARLLAKGYRPGQVVPKAAAELQALVLASGPASATAAEAPEQQAMLALLRRHDVSEVRRMLNQAVVRLGLARFLTDWLAPLNVAVGEAWVRSEIQVFEEHLYTESVTAVLRGTLGGLPPLAQSGRPRVLLTTLPQETHALGLLMAEVMLTLEGCTCISLGTQTPLHDIARAAAAHDVQVVGLSISTAFPTQKLLRDVQYLRSLLLPSIALWAGGRHPALGRSIGGVTHVATLQDIAVLLDVPAESASELPSSRSRR